MSYLDFDYSLDFGAIDFRKQPQLYRMGRGEQGVLLVQPYKSEILPYWRFRNPSIAKKSSQEVYDLFLKYVHAKDFVGADMARKFLQMGWTRSRRYANHKSGRKYSDENKKNAPEIPIGNRYKTEKNNMHSVKRKIKKVLPIDHDPEKAKSAAIFYKMYKKAKSNHLYQEMLDIHKKKYPTSKSK